jgi:hypothetical protein
MAARAMPLTRPTGASSPNPPIACPCEGRGGPERRARGAPQWPGLGGSMGPSGCRRYLKRMAKGESEAEEYYRHKNAARRQRKVARAVGTTACCGIPCLLTSILAAAVVAVAVAACGGAAMSTVTGTPTLSPATTPTPTSTPALTASSVYAALQAAGLPVSGLIVYTAATDPNHLLGRPLGYLSKCAWSDSRVPAADTAGLSSGDVGFGGGVEVFSTAAEATARAQYIATAEAAVPLVGSEYDYLAGRILIRVSQYLTPSQAATYGAAFGATLYAGS